ncbi:PP2C family protein-serine/threonine phosphatase [Dactylosporangium sucinum]|uniref:PPM-type phosphatase domain-containing protein n=1 Tax=Dactylosporangium sucinum TaxID=1424081 RepID=A0A917TGD2_9ACTN|nr:protein phosphatase 2C domain-containing protein [Dactylosporangium sucinum]GGM22396.1 hypothetical protein GCM10007977_024440 [Dactylosporangium sucinum]
MTTTVTVAAAGRTHVGLVRRRNEDALHVGPYLVAVADGLGGHVAGDVASADAMKALHAYDRPVDSEALARALGTAVHSINEALRRRTAADPELAGMATTLVALLFSGSSAALANLGDSRAYVLRRPGDLAQITEDHTYGHLVADSKSVPNLPERLSRFLDGRTDGRSPDITLWQFQPGDRFLLCSDGLSSYVPHAEIQNALTSSPTPHDAADRLVELGLAHGGHDNITVIVLDVRST